MISIKQTKYYFPGAIELSGRRHLDQVELLVGRLLFDHLPFTCVGGWVETTRVSSHMFIAQQVVGNIVHELTSSCEV
jgi:hypothetical protein